MRIIALDIGTVTGRYPPLPMITAIAAHRAAWRRYQDAAPGEATVAASDEECEALHTLLRTIPATREEVTALRDYLSWWCTEEHQRRENEPELFALHALLQMTEAPGRDLAERVVRYFVGPDGDPSALDFDFFDADAEVLRTALAIAPPAKGRAAA